MLVRAWVWLVHRAYTWRRWLLRKPRQHFVIDLGADGVWETPRFNFEPGEPVHITIRIPIPRDTRLD